VPDSGNLHATFLDRIRTFHHSDFHPEALVRAKHLLGATISVCIPAHNEARTVGAVVSTVRRHLVENQPLVDEVIVLDDRSRDGTAVAAAAAGARVVPVAEILPEVMNPPGKGNVLWRSLHATSNDIVCWIDADIADFRAEMVTGILGPLLHVSHLGFVKGYYARPTDGGGAGGGRVTELVAKPLIASLFPHLVGVRQPLAGATAARRELLRTLPFQAGWGVELGLLLDVARIHGVDVIAQTDLGELRHRNKPLQKLIPQAAAVIDVALARCGIPNEVWAPLLASAGSGNVGRSLVELPPIEGPELAEVGRAQKRSA
jgi:glucosyl-3-phosphoglycerate synthase